MMLAEESARAQPAPYGYDVFISYSHRDADWVFGWLVPRLKAEGLVVCTDKEAFDVGVPALENMENAVAASRHTVLVLTPAWSRSEWTQYESLLNGSRDPGGVRQRTLPVLREKLRRSRPHRRTHVCRSDRSARHRS